MKKIIITTLLFLASFFLYAEGDYRGGNGTLLRKETIGDKTIEIRKFEVSDHKSGLWDIQDATIYDNYSTKNKIGTLTEGVVLDFFEICFIPNSKEADQGDLWIKLSDKKTTGWVHAYSDIWNPYADDNYSYTGSIESGSRTYHIRKYNNDVSWWKDESFPSVTVLEIRDKPGKDAKIIAKVKKGTSHFNAVSITEDDAWLMIEYKKGKFGWTESDCFFAGSMAGKEYSNIPDRVILNGFSSADDVGP